MAYVVGMFMVRINRRKAVMVGEDAVVRGDWWVMSSWAELCIVCKMWMISVKGWVLGVGLGCCSW